MTAQIAERLIFEGENLAMCSEPLSDYFALGGREPPFDARCTALWRGYVGTWEVRDSRLYLLSLEGELADGSVANLATIFPGFPDRVFAHWFSDTVRLPRGRQLEYVHMGYGSTFEQDIFLEFEKGVLVKSWVVENGKAAPGAPEGYDIAAFTTLPPEARGLRGLGE